MGLKLGRLSLNKYLGNEFADKFKPESVVLFLLCCYVLLLAFPLHPSFSQTVLTAAVILQFATATNKGVSLPKSFWLGLCLFLIASILASFFSINPKVSITASISVVSGIFLLLVCSFFNSVSVVSLLLKVLCVTGLIIALVFISAALSDLNASVESWIASAGYPHFGVPNDLSLLAIIAVIAFALFNFSQDTKERFFLLFVVITLIACLLIYRSRSGLLVTVILICGLVFQLMGKKWLYIIPLFALFGLLVDSLTGFAFLQKLIQINTLSTRIPLWIAAFNMFLDTPWLGHGPGAFSLVYRNYIVLNQLPAWVVVDNRDMPWPHNLYLELLAERGVFGFFSFAVLTGFTFRLLYQSYSIAADTITKSRATVLCYALGSILLLGLVETSLLRHWVIVIYFLVLGLTCILWKSSKKMVSAS